MRRAVILALVILGCAGAVRADDGDQDSTIQQLRRDLLDAQAAILQRDIQISTLHATLDSVTESARADALVRAYQQVYGGVWVWDGNANRPVQISGDAAEKEQHQ